jgi:hypothetical protein
MKPRNPAGGGAEVDCEPTLSQGVIICLPGDPVLTFGHDGG